jgi:PhzF family phenazine biosynthesis protein
MPGLPVFIIDASASRPFRGNPAAVCLLDIDISDAAMQDVAAELNLSETAFVDVRSSAMSLRWLTPTAEVALCGHATLAAAHVLLEQGLASHGGGIDFNTRSVRLVARSRSPAIALDMPAMRLASCVLPSSPRNALGVTPI